MEPTVHNKDAELGGCARDVSQLSYAPVSPADRVLNLRGLDFPVDQNPGADFATKAKGIAMALHAANLPHFRSYATRHYARRRFACRIFAKASPAYQFGNLSIGYERAVYR